MDKLLLRPDEAAFLLGIARSKLYALLARKVLPSVRVGGSLRVPTQALRQWVARQEARGRAQTMPSTRRRT